MKIITDINIIVVLLLLIAGCTDDFLSSGIPDNVAPKISEPALKSNNSPETIAFRGFYEETFQIKIIPDQPFDSLFVTGTGTATHLGKSEIHIKERLLPLEFLPGGNILKGEVIFIGANGDQLYADVLGVGQPTSEGLVFAGIISITGGTGKFADAAGKVFFEGSGQLTTFPNGVAEVRFNGNLTL